MDTSITQGRTMPLESSRENTSFVNVSENERRLSLLAGLGLLLFGMRQRGWRGVAMMLIGGELVYRGATGFCWVYRALGMNSAVAPQSKGVSVPHEQGIRIEERILIHRPVEEIYAFWRNFENLPRFMQHLQSVEVLDNKRSRWTAVGPANVPISWDAEIINERRNEVIGWRSTDNAVVANAGSVSFRPVFNGQATEVTVKIEYIPPAGEVGAFVAKVFGREPRQQIPEDMQRLKQLMENTPVTEFPLDSGRQSGSRDGSSEAEEWAPPSGRLSD